MAFLAASGDRKYFFLDHYIGGNPNLKVWVYITPDPIETIIAASYIDSSDVIRVMSVGDFIQVFRVTDRNDLSTQIEVFELKVTAKSGTASVTLARSDVLTDIASLRSAEWEADIVVTIAVGGQAIQALPANPNRALLLIFADPDNSEPAYKGQGTGALVGTGPGIEYGLPYDSHFPPSAADLLSLSINAATAGTKVTIRQKVFTS